MRRSSDYNDLLLKAFIRESFIQCKKDDLFERKNNLISKSRKEKRSLKEEKLRKKRLKESIDELNEFLQNLAEESMQLEEAKKRTSIKYLFEFEKGDVSQFPQSPDATPATTKSNNNLRNFMLKIKNGAMALLFASMLANGLSSMITNNNTNIDVNRNKPQVSIVDSSKFGVPENSSTFQQLENEANKIINQNEDNPNETVETINKLVIDNVLVIRGNKKPMLKLNDTNKKEQLQNLEDLNDSLEEDGNLYRELFGQAKEAQEGDGGIEGLFDRLDDIDNKAAKNELKDALGKAGQGYVAYDSEVADEAEMYKTFKHNKNVAKNIIDNANDNNNSGESSLENNEKEAVNLNLLVQSYAHSVVENEDEYKNDDFKDKYGFAYKGSVTTKTGKVAGSEDTSVHKEEAGAGLKQLLGIESLSYTAKDAQNNLKNSEDVLDAARSAVDRLEFKDLEGSNVTSESLKNKIKEKLKNLGGDKIKRFITSYSGKGFKKYIQKAKTDSYDKGLENN